MFGFEVIFFIMVGLIIFSAIAQYIKNENSPGISTKAQIVRRKRAVNTHTDANGVMTSDEKLILKFQLDTGSEMKFTVARRIFRSIPEFQWVTLTFQGTRFLKFQWEDGIVEK